MSLNGYKKIKIGVKNLVIKILTAIIVLIGLYKCIIKEYYGSNTHLLFE